MNTVQCNIVSTEEEIFSGEVEFLSITGSLGDLGIHPGHAPLLTEIKPGPAELRLANGEERVFYVSGGYLEVQPHQIMILADTVHRAADLDEDAAEQARAEIEREMEDRRDTVDYGRAAARLAELSAQLRTLRQFRQKRS